FNFEEGYFMHRINSPALKSLRNFELPFSPLDVEFVIAEVSDLFPGAGPGEDVDAFYFTDIEFITPMTRPSTGFWQEQAARLKRGDNIERPVQTLNYQSCQGNSGSQVTFNVDCGMARSISSALLLGRPNFDAPDAASGQPEFGVGSTVYDKLSYSSDLGIRSLRFTVNGKMMPEGKGISYSKYDPELYCLSFRHIEPGRNAYVPSTYLFDNAATVNGLSCRGWQMRWQFSDVLSTYADALASVNGTFGIVCSTVPEPPQYPKSVKVFKPDVELEIYYIVDQALVISETNVDWTPVW
ncbi:hypothetical protein HK097_006746, partial [Rhizophlyctis rosea]